MLLLLPLVAGCREELGPERFPTARVSGRVSVGGRPVRGGWIEFHPIEGTAGNVRSARVAPDGTFATDGVPVGRNMVGVAGGLIGLERSSLFHPLSSPIRRTVPPGASRLEIDLHEEQVAYEASLPRPR